MFNIKLKNASDGYKVFLNSKELSLKYSNGQLVYSSSECNKGVCTIRIFKDIKPITPFDVCCFWVSTILTGYDKAIVSMYRSAKRIDKEFCVYVDDNFDFCYDTYTNRVIFSSETYETVRDDSTEDQSLKRKVNFYVRLPLLILMSVTLIPIWLLSISMMVKSFDYIALLIFVFVSVLIIFFVVSWIRDRKNKWR